MNKDSKHDTLTETSDGLDSSPEDFVKPLVQEIVRIKLPEIDLTTPEKARQTGLLLEKTMEELDHHRDRVFKLKELLEQKKFELE